eukprot:TRINITY_DN9657_c0_g1_i1.p1 TRINITY_DN9657_c0_g1~~TRINITY_DN9657_c0_g1_i1.p1  ORF type:complete len:577 (+),score=219.34 TRINITY_DN9657_c0_g1_i1:72-1802(+)
MKDAKDTGLRTIKPKRPWFHKTPLSQDEPTTMSRCDMLRLSTAIAIFLLFALATILIVSIIIPISIASALDGDDDGGVGGGQEALWPWPARHEPGPDKFLLDSYSFRWDIIGKSNDVLLKAIERYNKTMFNLRLPLTPYDRGEYDLIDNIEISVSSDNSTLAEDTDESYILLIESDNIYLKSETVFGAMRGLETFSQIVKRVVTPRLYLVNETFIIDNPRFSYRGTMIDTSKEFIKIEDILKHLDIMAAAKMNVLHWRIVGDETFRFESKVYPKITESEDYYKQSDIKDIVQYAYERGIRIIPELDSPGNTLSWSKQNPYVPSTCKKEIEGEGTGPLNPVISNSTHMVAALIKEFDGVFTDQYVHIGGEKLDYRCWQQSPRISQHMSDFDNMTVQEVMAEYQSYVAKEVKKYHRGLILWEDSYDEGFLAPKNNHAFEVWREATWNTKLADITRNGHKAILSAPWFIDTDNLASSHELELLYSNFYSVEPLSILNGTNSLVQGGEMCLRSGFKSSDFLSKMWPLASTVAERLWSKSSINNADASEHRYKAFACLLYYRGLLKDGCATKKPNRSMFKK